MTRPKSSASQPSAKSAFPLSHMAARVVMTLIARRPGALAHAPVVEVVRRGDLDRARALLGVGVGIGDDRDAPPDERQADGLAHEMGVAAVVGMDGDAGVAEHGLRARRGDRQIVAGLPFGRVAVLVEGGRVFVGLAVSSG
jgi:hypothetical protein